MKPINYACFKLEVKATRKVKKELTQFYQLEKLKRINTILSILYEINLAWAIDEEINNFILQEYF